MGPCSLRSAGARAQPCVRGETRGARAPGTRSPGAGGPLIRRGGEGVQLGGVCAAEEEADQTEVVREKLGFSGGFLQLDLSDFSPRRRTAGARPGLGFPRRRPAWPRTDAPARPRPAGAVGPSRKAGGCRSAPEAGFLAAGLAAGEAECWEREEGDGILLNFSTVVSSLLRGEIHLVCPSGRAARELQQFREVASSMWVSLQRCVSFSLGRFSASP